jgi:hypothetical protein
MEEGKKKVVYSVLFENPKRPLGRPRNRRHDNISYTSRTEIMECIRLADGKDQ